MLDTNLNHITSAEELTKALAENENVMVCCGRMGPMCIPVYDEMESLQKEYAHVAFSDMEFDSPEAMLIKGLPECRGFRGLPFTVYYKNGNVVTATASIQSKDDITQILNKNFSL